MSCYCPTFMGLFCDVAHWLSFWWSILCSCFVRVLFHACIWCISLLQLSSVRIIQIIHVPWEDSFLIDFMWNRMLSFLTHYRMLFANPKELSSFLVYNTVSIVSEWSKVLFINLQILIIQKVSTISPWLDSAEDFADTLQIRSFFFDWLQNRTYLLS